MNLYDIAEATNRSPAFVWKHLKDAGVDTGKHRKQVVAQLRGRNQSIVALRRKGKKLEEIGKELGLTRARVGQIIKEFAPELIRGSG
jgi:DNA-directed RNA polymerase specialized sigma subunit